MIKTLIIGIIIVMMVSSFAHFLNRGLAFKSECNAKGGYVIKTNNDWKCTNSDVNGID